MGRVGLDRATAAPEPLRDRLEGRETVAHLAHVPSPRTRRSKGGDAPLRGHATATARSPSTAARCAAWQHSAPRPAAHQACSFRPSSRPASARAFHTAPGDRPRRRLHARPCRAAPRAAAPTPRPVSGSRSTAGRAPGPRPPRRRVGAEPAPFTRLDPTMPPTSCDIGFSFIRVQENWGHPSRQLKPYSPFSALRTHSSRALDSRSIGVPELDFSEDATIQLIASTAEYSGSTSRNSA